MRSNKVFVNISTREFEECTYDATKEDAFSYKPDTGYWGAIKKDNGYFSEWDREYGLNSNRKGNETLYITSFYFNPERVYTLRPSEDELILEGYKSLLQTRGTNLTTAQKRLLLLEYLKDRKCMQNIEHVICQIDDAEDLIQMERIFGGFDRTADEIPAEVFENLPYKVRSAFVECFSGVEVTENALSEAETADDIIRLGDETEKAFPGYQNAVGFWDVPSVAVFNTDAIEVFEGRVLPDREIKFFESMREELEL